MEETGNSDEEKREEVALDPKMFGIEEISYEVFEKKIPEVVQEKIKEAIKIIETSTTETKENLKNAVSAFKDGLIGDEFWDPIGEIADYWPLVLSRNRAYDLLALTKMNGAMIRDARYHMRIHGEDSKAKFYRKRDFYFWDNTGKANPVQLLERLLGRQQQMPRGQPPPAPEGMEIV